MAMLCTVPETPATRIELAEAPSLLAVMHLADESTTKVGPTTYRKRILRYGAWNHPNAPGGVLKVDRPYAKSVVANFTSRVLDTVKAIKGHPTSEAERIANAAGDVVALEDTDDGLYAHVSVSPTVAADIDAGNIVGCSAGLLTNYVDHEVGGRGAVGPVLEHLAFTNTPYIKDLGGFDPVHLADDANIVLLSLANTDPPEKTMDRNELVTAAKALGIDIEALEADATAKPTLEAELETVKAALAAAPKAEAIEGAKTEAKAELVTALSDALGKSSLIELAEGQSADLGSVVTAIVTNLDAGRKTQARLDLSEATHAVDALVSTGHILPTQREGMIKLHLSDRDTFTSLIPSAPIVDLSERGTTGAQDDPDTITLADGTSVADEVTRLLALVDD